MHHGFRMILNKKTGYGSTHQSRLILIIKEITLKKANSSKSSFEFRYAGDFDYSFTHPIYIIYCNNLSLLGTDLRELGKTYEIDGFNHCLVTKKTTMKQ